MEKIIQIRPPLTSMERDFVNFFYVEVNGERRTMSLMAGMQYSKIRKKIVEDVDEDVAGRTMKVDFKLECGTMIYFSFRVVNEPLQADLVVGFDFIIYYKIRLNIEKQQCVFLNGDPTINLNFAATVKDIPQTPIKTNVCVYSIGPVNSGISESIVDTTGYPIGSQNALLIKNELDRMLAKGLIRPSVSAWSSPFTLKPHLCNSEMRFYVDYTQVNKTIPAHPFKLPGLQTRLMLLKGAKVFSLIMLKDPYDYIRLEESLKQKTAFSTPFGLYEYNVLPETFKSAGVLMHLYMKTLFKDIDSNYCSIYKDTFLIWAENDEEHDDKLGIVVDKITENDFEVNPGKSQLRVTELRYFGQIVDAKGYKIDPNLVKKLLNIPRPQTAAELQEYLSNMIHYQPYIISFLDILSNPNNVGGSKKFFWSAEKEKVFLEIRTQISRRITLVYPDFKRPFSLLTFAVPIGIGTILLQADAESGKQKFICCYGRAYTFKERRESEAKRELIAIVASYSYFMDYLRNNEYILLTHKRRIKTLLADSRHKFQIKALFRLMNLTEDRIKDRHGKP